MNDNKWITEDYPEPWEKSSYSTGATRPPKSHRGVLAILLITLIFLGGVATAFNLLNIRLFQENRGEASEDASFRFSNQEASSDQVPEQSEISFRPETQIQLQLSQTPVSVENVPQEGGLSLQEIYSKTVASVVSITCTTASGTSTGSGVVLSEDGYIVTNSHVIAGAHSLQVLFHDGKTLSAQVVGADDLSDLAVLRVAATELIPAEFGDDTALRVGDSVVAIGDPLGTALRGTMTDGIVSAINRDVRTSGRTMTLIQTNAALNAGNSGGPLINCYGQIIGINTMKIGDNMSTAGVEGLGFAIPSTTVKEIVDQLLAQGYVSGRPCLGVTVQQLSSFDQFYYRLPSGLYITEVAQDTDAAQKGLVPGDVLLSIDDHRLTSTDALQQLLYGCNAGDTVTAVIYRDGQQYQITFALSEVK